MKAKQPDERNAKKPAVAAEAVRLLGKWRRVSGGHVAFGAGCSCGAAAISVRVQDYEQDILGFLRGRHGTDSPTIMDLLTGVARGGAQTDLAMLADLERSLDSFESAHRGGGGS
ncbi:MAG TPA: hypothetical protein VEX61_06175 [Burkholderiales bacterium]|nr:hypothetical protein [Burkholderiales bacterium]